MDDPLKPTADLLVKLGSLVVHYEELTSPHGHPFDRSAIEQLRQDPQVDQWFTTMQSQGFLPRKRQ